jgi:hypothetical protein
LHLPLPVRSSFLPGDVLASTTSVSAPALAANIEANNPAAPAPIIHISVFIIFFNRKFPANNPQENSLHLLPPNAPTVIPADLFHREAPNPETRHVNLGKK